MAKEKEKEKWSVRFYLNRKSTTAAGENPLRVYITVHKSSVLSTIGISINKDAWDAKNQMAMTGNAKGLSADDINAKLIQIRQEFKKYEGELDKENNPTTEELRSRLENITSTGRKHYERKIEKEQRMAEEKEQQRPKDVVGYFDMFVSEQSQECGWSESTKKKMRTMRKRLENLGYKSFEELDDAGVARFINYCRHHQEDTKKKNIGQIENTVAKNYGLLRWFLRWAWEKGYADEKVTSRKTFSFKKGIFENKIVYLEQGELKHLENIHIPANGTEITVMDKDFNETTTIATETGAWGKVRDFFIFCCYTGLRFSDAAALRKSDIYDGKIHVITKKTSDALEIEVNSHAQKILDKYKDVGEKNGLALPVMANQNMNYYLKQLCQYARIDGRYRYAYTRTGRKIVEEVPKWAVISTHAARRTFVVTALSLGITAEVVMKWTGHSDYTAMKPYIDIVNKAKQEAMDKFNAI